jgi:hypothetical protein
MAGLSATQATEIRQLSSPGSLLRHPSDSEESTIREFAIGRATGRNSVHFALPFYGDDGHVDGVAIAALRLDWLTDYIGKRSVLAGAALPSRTAMGNEPPMSGGGVRGAPGIAAVDGSASMYEKPT